MVNIVKSDSVSSQESSFTEGSFEAAMRKIAEKKKPKNQEKNSSCSKEDKIKKLLEEYEQLPLEKSATNYWKKLSKSTDKYERILSSIAKKYLTPPASTISVERLFSTGGQALPDSRCGLLAKTVVLLVYYHG